MLETEPRVLRTLARQVLYQLRHRLQLLILSVCGGFIAGLIEARVTRRVENMTRQRAREGPSEASAYIFLDLPHPLSNMEPFSNTDKMRYLREFLMHNPPRQR